MALKNVKSIMMVLLFLFFIKELQYVKKTIFEMLKGVKTKNYFIIVIKYL
jgi:hypothetical protein